MAFEVTANRKRPKTFNELAGQDFVVSTLKNSLDSGRLAHAYLFSGPRGVGKTSAARILAKALNCLSTERPTSSPCGSCVNCREISQGSAMDVIEIDGASNTSVNDIRRIKDEVLFSPSSCRKKVYIIDEVHMLSNSAFNALLKTIEEPPDYVVFIFATTEIHKVPATIRSRCQQYHFQLFSIETIQELLTRTAAEGGINIDEDALFWIAKEATGSMRDGYTLFDQIVSLSVTHEGTEQMQITMKLIREKLGLIGIDVMNTLVEALWHGNTMEAASIIQDTLHRGVTVEQVIIDLVEYFRSLLLIKQGIKRESLIGSRIEQFSLAIRRAYTKEQLEAGLELLLDLYRNIRYTLNQRFELDLAVSRLADLRHMVSNTTLVGRIASLKDQLLRGEITYPEKSQKAQMEIQNKLPENTGTGKDEVPTDSAPESERNGTSEEHTYPASPGENKDLQTHAQPAPTNPAPKPLEIRDVEPKGEAEEEPETPNMPTKQEITRNHIEAVQAGLKDTSPALAAALGKIADWHYHEDTLELIFPDAYTAGKITADIRETGKAFYKVLNEHLSLKVITVQEHDREKREAEGIDDAPRNTDDKVEMVMSVFRGSKIT